MGARTWISAAELYQKSDGCCVEKKVKITGCGRSGIAGNNETKRSCD